jgi:TPR repeat protein
MYVTGEASDDCETRDLEQAKYWFRRAAQQDDVEAMYNLGLVYQVRYPMDCTLLVDSSVLWRRCSACVRKASEKLVSKNFCFLAESANRSPSCLTLVTLTWTV